MRITSASLIYLVIFFSYLPMSGAPFRVHIGPAVGLFIGFFLPALMVGKLKEIRKKIFPILAFIFTGIIALCFFNSLAIAKADFVSMLIPLLPAGTIALSGLLLVHVLMLMAGEQLIKQKAEPVASGQRR